MRMSDLFQFLCRCRSYLACHAGVFFGRTDVLANCSLQSAMLKLKKREEELKMRRKDCYFYTPHSSSIIKSKIAASNTKINRQPSPVQNTEDLRQQ